MERLNCIELHQDSAEAVQAERLYLTAFPEIERHPIEELHEACNHKQESACQWLIFKDEELFVGMAYMITYKDIAFLLYFAVDDNMRNKSYGSRILKSLQSRYENMEMTLLIESLHETCDNMNIRIRRKEFYLRNGFYDTGFIQPCNDKSIFYDILSTAKTFNKYKYMEFVEHYPLSNFMSEILQLK